jgi:hypothetical protein
MSYQAQSELYRGPERGRYEACVREQGLIFSADGRPDIAALGHGVTKGSQIDIDAVIAAVCFGPNWASISEDGALLSAVQAVWPTVAQSLYSGEVAS